MAFLNLLFPSEDAESAYSIDYEALYAEGVRGIIFDIDNTLVPHGLPADMKSRDLFRRLHAVGLKTCLISNNDGPRVRPFADAVHSDYMPDAGKPLKRGYKAAMGLMGTDCGNTVFVGDQIYTDILGANLAGIRSVLVKPVAGDYEWQIVLKRKLEIPVLRLYEKKKKSKASAVTKKA